MREVGYTSFHAIRLKTTVASHTLAGTELTAPETEDPLQCCGGRLWFVGTMLPPEMPRREQKKRKYSPCLSASLPP